jgi:hypothetical protein
MKFKYIGRNEWTATLGHEFYKNIPVEVSEMAAKKLINNTCFEFVPDEKPIQPKRTRKKVINDN